MLSELSGIYGNHYTKIERHKMHKYKVEGYKIVDGEKVDASIIVESIFEKPIDASTDIWLNTDIDFIPLHVEKID